MRFLTIWEILIRVDLNQAVKHIFKLRDCVPYFMDSLQSAEMNYMSKTNSQINQGWITYNLER